MFLAMGFIAGSGGSTLARFVLSTVPAARMTKAGGGVPVDNNLVEAVSDASGASHDGAQATGAQQPTAQAEPFPGVLGMEFAGNDNIQVASPGGDIAELVLVISGTTTGDVYARDTTATTDKPSIIVDVLESF